ncbi:Serine/threonine-protein kinase smu1 [Paramecium bursaria]
MNTQIRYCGEKGHENQQATYLCALYNCNLFHRWCCHICIQERIHQHDQKDNIHMILWQEMIVQKQEEIDKLQQNELFSQGLDLCSSLLIIIDEYKKHIEQYLQTIQKEKETLQLLILDLQPEKFIILNNNRINEIMQFYYNKTKLSQSVIEPKENLDKQIIHLKTLIQNYQDNIASFTNFVDLKKRKYTVKKIDQIYRSCFASQISNNEQYLAYEGKNRDIVKIFDIKQDKIAKEILLDGLVYVCQFSQDSSLLYVGCGPNVFCYNLLNNFEKIFRLSIHKGGVLNIKTIQERYLITCSYDKTIRKTDIKRKKLIFKLRGHTQFINAIDYNELKNYIISGSADKSIKLWDCNNQSIIINKMQSHLTSITQIQLINYKDDFYSLDDSSHLYKWRIDLNQRDFIKIQQFSDPYNIYSFYQVNQNNNLILICEFHIKILNQQGDTINIFQHQAGNDFCVLESRQLENANFIHIRSQCTIITQKQKKSCWPQLRIETRYNSYILRFTQIFQQFFTFMFLIQKLSSRFSLFINII